MRVQLLLTLIIIALAGCIGGKPPGPQMVFMIEPIAADGKPVDALTLEEGTQVLVARIAAASQIKEAWITSEVDASSQRIRIIVPESATETTQLILGYLTSAESGLVIRKVHADSRRLLQESSKSV
ncbi:MAG: hypothetical protein AAF585_01175, partial [Verrucomicrobiota bacterium]